MPHITPEIGDHLEKLNVPTLFKEIHHGLSDFANIEACKSRLLKTLNPFAGSGLTKKTFAHITMLLLPSRTEQQKRLIQEIILTLLKKNITPLTQEGSISIDLSVRIEDLHTYGKITI